MRLAICSSVAALALVGSTVFGWADRPPAQVELDRIVVRVAGRIITQSDIRQARMLRLVDDVSSDAAVQRALENRLLILNEMGRAAPVPAPSDAEIASRQSGWQQSLGGAPDLSRLMAESGTSESAVQDWVREDLRIRAYLQRQFGALPENERGRAMNDWLARLRQRADLR